MPNEKRHVEQSSLYMHVIIIRHQIHWKIEDFAILYLAGSELLKAGDSGNGWDVVRDRTSTGLRLEPGVKVGLSAG